MVTILELPHGFRAIHVKSRGKDFTCADVIQIYSPGEPGGPDDLLGKTRYMIKREGQEPIWVPNSDVMLVR